MIFGLTSPVITRFVLILVFSKLCTIFSAQ